MEWISVKDRLPADGDKTVLAVVNGYREDIVPMSAIELARYSSDEGWILEAYPELEDMHVTHWIPLPDLPKEKEKSE